MKTTTTWKEKHRFDSRQDEKSFMIDGDREQGPGPKSLLLSGLAGCSGIDVVDILEKMRVEFSDLIIEAESEQTEDHPKVFTDILLTYHIKTVAENENKVRKAIELSLDKYCGVAAMLKKNSPVRYELVLE